MIPTVGSWQAFALGAAFFAGLTAFFGKIGVTGINSNLATFIRTVVILGVTAILISARQEWIKPDRLSGRSLLFLVLSGCATGFSWLCYYRALQLGPASRVAPIDKLSVVFAIILSVTFLGESLTFKGVLGAAMITIGALLML